MGVAEEKKWFGAILGNRLTANKVDIHGVIDFTLGDLNWITTEISGSGLTGKINVPIDMFEPLDLTITHGPMTKNLNTFLDREGVDLVFGYVYSNINQDLKNSKEGNKIYARGLCTSHSPGSRKSGESIEGSTTFSVVKLRIVDGHYNELLRYEPLLGIFAVNGVEMTQDTNNFLNDD